MSLLARSRTFAVRTGVTQGSLAAWYFVFATWGVLNLRFPPSGPASELGELFLLVAGFAAVAGTVAVVGALLVKQPRRGTLGLLLEQLGLLGMQAANVSYLFVIVALAFGPGTDWYARIAYCFGVSCAIGVRQGFLLPKYRAIGTETQANRVIVH